MQTTTPLATHANVHETESLFEVLLRRRRIVLLAVLATVLLAAAYLAVATPKYLSRARIVVEPTGAKMLGAEFNGDGLATHLNTQAELLRSAPIAVDALQRVDSTSMRMLADVSDPVAWIAKELIVTPGRESNMITLSLTTAHRKEAARLLGAIVDAYIDYTTGHRRSTAGGMLEILDKQRDQRQKAFEEVNLQLRDLETASLAGGEESGANERLARLAEAVTAAEMRRIEAESRYESARTIAAGAGGVARLVEVESARGAIVLDEEYRRLQLQLSELRASHANLTQRFGDKHPSVRGLAASITDVSQQLAKKQQHMVLSHLMNLSAETDTARRVQEQTRAARQRAQKSVARQQADGAQLERIRAEAKRIADQREALDRRIAELSVVETAGALEISVAERAHTMSKPASPRPVQVMGISLVLGAAFGALGALAGEWCDRRFRGLSEMKTLLGLDTLGVIPRDTNRMDGIARGRIAHDDRACALAEAYRDLRTALLFNADRQPCRTLLVTSPTPDDGKSTVAGNLAITMAQAGKRVLLIDADLRKPTLHHIFAPTQTVGLTSVFHGDASIADAITDTDIDRLHLLAAGIPAIDPSELLGSERFMNLIEELSAQFDCVVIDSPPVTAATDARILAAQCDGTLLVLRIDKADRRQAMLTRDTLASVGAQMVGVAVNAAPSHMSRGRYQAYEAYAAPRSKAAQPLAAGMERKELEPTCAQ